VSDIQQLQANLAALYAQVEAAHAQLQQAQLAVRDSVLEQIKDAITLNGINPIEAADFIRALAPPAAEEKPKRARKPRVAREATDSGNVVNFPRYVDPTDPSRAYVRGVLPGWFKETMQGLGLDPASKEDREKFKAEHLRREAA
jgi:DNA-binding protein H-NS